MKYSKRGMTLLELVIVMTMIGTLVLWVGNFSSLSLRTGGALNELNISLLGSTGQSLTREIQNLFSRAVVYKTTQYGPSSPGYLIGPDANKRGQGALVVRTDLRPRTTFNPSTSALYDPVSKKYPNLSKIGVVCCQPGISATAVDPLGGAVSIQSACGNDWGATVITWDPSGAKTNQVCYRHIVSMNALSLGSKPSFGMSDTLQLDFEGQTQFDKQQPIPQPLGARRLFFGLTVGIGNSLTSPIITLGRTGQSN